MVLSSYHIPTPNGGVQRAELARLRCDGVLATSRLCIIVVILVAIFVDKDRDEDQDKDQLRSHLRPDLCRDPCRTTRIATKIGTRIPCGPRWSSRLPLLASCRRQRFGAMVASLRAYHARRVRSAVLLLLPVQSPSATVTKPVSETATETAIVSGCCPGHFQRENASATTRTGRHVTVTCPACPP